MTGEADGPDAGAAGRDRSSTHETSLAQRHDDLWEDRSKPICVISPSGPRRVFGIAMLAALGVMFIWVGFLTFKSNSVTAAVLGLLGIISFWCASVVASATSASILLIQKGLITSDKIIVAELDNIKEVERGLFALKPSSGFVIFLKKPMPLVWKPGLWWRFGRRIGIGGATTAAEGKIMAEAIQASLINRAKNADSN